MALPASSEGVSICIPFHLFMLVLLTILSVLGQVGLLDVYFLVINLFPTAPGYSNRPQNKCKIEVY